MVETTCISLRQALWKYVLFSCVFKKYISHTTIYLCFQFFSESIDKIDVVSYNEVEEILVVSELRESALSGCGVVKSSFNGIYQFKQIQLH